MTSSKPLSLRKTVLISLGIAIIPIFLAALSLYTHYKWEAATQEKLAELNARDFPITPEELNRRYHQHGLDPIENALPIYNRAFEKLSDKPIDFPNVFQHGSDLQPIDAEILLEMSEVLSENEAACPS
ncbi:MAG TPA: hypothetical protein VK041_01995 [Opitutales bacterium]|nr:hypothetical protein [Opitutales bacterium]